MYQEVRVLDLYAGSGSLGIEALSRGAGWTDFVECSRRQCAVIWNNLEATGFSRKARVHCADVPQNLASLTGPYQLVLMDPPYRLQELDVVLESLLAVAGLVTEGGVVVVGHSKHLTLLPSYSSPSADSGKTLQLALHRRYGDNVVDFFREGDKGW
jgi:16S rRNA (guanine(966)-N(2))-methyltransferase RsmD